MKLFDNVCFVIAMSLLLLNTQRLNCESNDNNNQLVIVETSEENETSKSEKIKFDISEEEFVATNEWKPIKEGQAIPKGLHVRLNLETGQKEAKLMDNDEDTRPANYNEKIREAHNKAKMSIQFEEAIKNLNDELNQGGQTPEEKKHEEEVKKNFRTYEELKKEMHGLNMDIKTDNEIMIELFDKFNKSDNNEEKMTILKDIEFYVHQYDNGLLLFDLNGFDLIAKELNKTEDLSFRIEAFAVFGSAIQSNPKAQVQAFKSQLLELILSSFSKQLQSTAELPLKNHEYNSKLLFCLSTLLRNFPFAQKEFVRFGGIELLDKLVESSTSLKVKLKAVTLLNDLIQEKSDVVKSPEEPNANESKVLQYKEIDVLKELINRDWCRHFEALLLNAADHDTREKVLQSTLNLIEPCEKSFGQMTPVLDKLAQEYTELLSQLEQENADSREFFDNILSLIRSVMEKLKQKGRQEL